MNAGCRIHNVSVNNISYADDMVLFSPSVASIRRQLEVCEEDAVEHGSTNNYKKGLWYLRSIEYASYLVKRVTNFKYLDRILTADSKDYMDMERERRVLSI